MSTEALLTVREAAKVLRVSRPTIYRWIEAGRLAAYRHGQLHQPGRKAGHGGALRVPVAEVHRKRAS